MGVKVGAWDIDPNQIKKSSDAELKKQFGPHVKDFDAFLLQLRDKCGGGKRVKKED